MDFFEHQDKARKKSGLLVFFFGIAVVLIIASVYCVFAPFVRISPPLTAEEWVNAGVFRYWDPALFLATSAGTLLLVLGGSLYKTTVLSQGGGDGVARLFDGDYLPAKGGTKEERRLGHIVEEMAIAAGTGIPRVYVIEEPGINAFAAGSTANDAVIGVTRGCLEKLTRQELQGVVAHEFSHILNGDMQSNMRLMGLLHGILLLSTIGCILMRSVGRIRGGDKGGWQVAVLFLSVGLGLMTIGYIGVFFGRLIKAAVSRQREYLADASAVQFTRDPEGLKGALLKIAHDASGSEIENPHREEIAHLLFSEGGRGGTLGWIFSGFGLLGSHPPLDERVRRLSAQSIREECRSNEESMSEPSGGGEGDAGFFLTSRGSAKAVKFPVVGRVEAGGISMARAWTNLLDPKIEAMARDTEGGWSLMLAMIMSRIPGGILRVGESATEKIPERVWAGAQEVFPLVEKLSAEDILVLLDLCLGGIRSVPRTRLVEIRESLRTVGIAGAEESLFGYMATSFIRARIMDSDDSVRRGGAGDNSLEAGTRGTSLRARILVSTLARRGHPETEDDAEMAYLRAVDRLRLGGVVSDSEMEEGILMEGGCGMNSFDTALFSLRKISPKDKKALLEACSICVFSDNAINNDEHALFRAIAGVLDCPVAPFLNQSSVRGLGAG